jgi:hypothetical protein
MTMTRSVFAFVGLLAFGCASAPAPRYAYDAGAPHTLGFAADSVPLAGPVEPAIALAPADSVDALDLQQPAQLAPAPQRPVWTSFFTVKGGYYSLEDTNKLDDGIIVNLSWTRALSKNFSSEVEIGYVDADGKVAGGSTDMWGIPFMVNARANIPVGPLDLYGGLGLGTIYYEVSSSSSSVSIDADGFAAAGDAFFGGAAHIGDTLAIGLEGQYYVTDSVSGLNGGLDAFAGMLTLSFSR